MAIDDDGVHSSLADNQTKRQGCRTSRLKGTDEAAPSLGILHAAFLPDSESNVATLARGDSLKRALFGGGSMLALCSTLSMVFNARSRCHRLKKGKWPRAGVFADSADCTVESQPAC